MFVEDGVYAPAELVLVALKVPLGRVLVDFFVSRVQAVDEFVVVVRILVSLLCGLLGWDVQFRIQLPQKRIVNCRTERCLFLGLPHAIKVAAGLPSSLCGFR